MKYALIFVAYFFAINVHALSCPDLNQVKNVELIKASPQTNSPAWKVFSNPFTANNVSWNVIFIFWPKSTDSESVLREAQQELQWIIRRNSKDAIPGDEDNTAFCYYTGVRGSPDYLEAWTPPLLKD